MDLKGEVAGRFLRIISVVALLMGLADAARLLGVTTGPVSPLAVLGPTGFAYLATFCLARLFAAVGLWIRASWGMVLLFGATAIELIVALVDGANLQIDIVGLVVRIVLLAALGTLFVLSFRFSRAHD